jgi:hypothetical protein
VFSRRKNLHAADYLRAVGELAVVFGFASARDDRCCLGIADITERVAGNQGRDNDAFKAAAQAMVAVPMPPSIAVHSVRFADWRQSRTDASFRNRRLARRCLFAHFARGRTSAADAQVAKNRRRSALWLRACGNALLQVAANTGGGFETEGATGENDGMQVRRDVRGCEHIQFFRASDHGVDPPVAPSQTSPCIGKRVKVRCVSYECLEYR